MFSESHSRKESAGESGSFVIGSLASASPWLSSLPELNEIPLSEIGRLFGHGRRWSRRRAEGEQAAGCAEIATLTSPRRRCYYLRRIGGRLVKALEEGARKCNRIIQERAAADRSSAGMATTLTVFIGVWPWIYLLQIGDSRYYQYRDGVLKQISRDQTIAQQLADQGIIPKELVPKSPLTNVLSSSIGGHKTEPVVTRLENSWEYIHLLCTDGLTKHVSDERIAERLGQMQSARQVCENLVQDALDGGGSDNITVVVGQANPKDPPA